MTDDSLNHYAEAAKYAEAAVDSGTMPERQDKFAQLASAHAALALCDAVLALRDEVESTPTRIERAIRAATD